MSLERLHQSMSTVIESYCTWNQTKNDNDDVPCFLVEGETVPLDFQVEVAWPNERQHAPCDAPNQTHQESKFWDEDGHQDRDLH